MKLTHLDLFSGIGGFALAARWAGIETVQFVEIDPFCQKVLAKNFKGVPIHDDITTYTYKQTEPTLRIHEVKGNGMQGDERIDNGRTARSPFLLTGGFPCQPFSFAGKRRGKEDDRYLWPEMLRVISEAKPHWVIGENVAGFINMGLDECISDLEGEGYEVQAFVIPACAVNAPHRRDRVWIVANRTWELFDRSRDARPAGRKKYTDTDRHAPDTASERFQRFGGKCKLRESKGEMQISREYWNEPWLEAATRLCRVDDGVSRRVDRLKCLGNAIVPQVAYQIMKAISKDWGEP